jgi:hypothetical protein
MHNGTTAAAAALSAGRTRATLWSRPPGITDAFYASIPVFDRFDRIVDAGLYKPLPHDWVLGLADIVGSAGAIAVGSYKSVNMAGAAVITAVANAAGTSDFPFVFGGDGASFAVPSDWAVRAREALAASAVFVREELGLSLRAAMVPVASVRAHGLDVRVARFAPSSHVTYAMFSGGGLAWAEQEMKRGAFALKPGPAGARPDLTGLSCRFEKVPSIHGTVASLLVMPPGSKTTEAFCELLEALLALAVNSEQAARPIPAGSLRLKWPPTGLDLMARTRHRPGHSLLIDRLYTGMRTLTAYVSLRFGLRIGRLRPSVYLDEVIENSDFRKYYDGLRMTLDCSEAVADRIEALLVDAAQRGVARFGLHRQSDVLMTCFRPSLYGKHFHFIDGAAGGYAMAARQLAG